MSVNLHRLTREIIIIGAGSWANKIAIDIRENLSDFRTKVIAARQILALEKPELEVLVSKSIIWIATKPTLQLDLLEKFIDFENKIIIEKPISTTMGEVSRFRKLLGDAKFQIYVSEPWTHSELWMTAKPIFLEGVKSIDIERFGENQREYIFPPQDWLPHDIYLLYDIYGSDFAELKELKSSWSEDRNKLALTFEVNDNIAVSILAGYSPTPRTALWNITLLDGTVYRIDFILKVITSHGRSNKLLTNPHNGDKSPISKMLSSALVATAPCSIFDYLTLYELLLIANE